MMENQNAIKLFEKLIRNTCTNEEFRKLSEWIKKTENKDHVHELMKCHWDKLISSDNNTFFDFSKMKNEINESIIGKKSNSTDNI